MSKSSLEAAAEAAAKVNAMLIAKGKLKLSPNQIKPKVNNNLLGRGKGAGDLITAEVDINDAPLSARNLLTRGHMQDEICKASGAAISTRGRYMTPEERQSIATPECRPLYLNVQASSFESVKIAVKKIQEVIDFHVHLSGLPKCPTAGVVTYPAVTSNGTFGLAQGVPTGHIPSGAHFVQDKIFIGLEHAHPEYPVRDKILGPGGSFLQHIRTETGATVTLRGKGSGFIEPTSGREAFEPLYIHITHPKPEGLQAAKALAVNLVETAHVEYAQWQQTQQSLMQPLTSVVLPQTTPVAYQNQMVVHPAALPVHVTPSALQAGSSVIATGFPTSVTPGTTLTSGIPSLIHANVQHLVPVSVMTSMPVSAQGITSQAVITYPTYVANTNPILTRPANTVLARPAIPSVSIIGVVPTLQTATYAVATTQPRNPFPTTPHLAYTQQPVSYAAVSAPQASVSPTTLMMSGSDTANYAVAATRFPVPHPRAMHKETQETKNPQFNGVDRKSREYAGEDKSACLQESNKNHPTETKNRRGAVSWCSEDKDLMPPPPFNLAVSASTNKKREMKSSENQEPEKKKIKGALGGLASIYGSDDSDEEDTTGEA